jgi:cyanate lyase
MMTKKEAAEAVRAAKARLKVTWAQLAEAIDRPLAWTTAALLGQHPMTADQADAAVALLDLGDDVREALQLQPTRGALDAPVPTDPDDLPVLRGPSGLRPHDQGTHPRRVRRRHHERD